MIIYFLFLLESFTKVNCFIFYKTVSYDLFYSRICSYSLYKDVRIKLVPHSPKLHIDYNGYNIFMLFICDMSSLDITRCKLRTSKVSFYKYLLLSWYNKLVFNFYTRYFK